MERRSERYNAVNRCPIGAIVKGGIQMSDNVVKPLGPVYHAGKRMPWGKGVVANGFVFLSGAEGRDPETDLPHPGIREQTRLALDRIKARLEEAGTSMENIVKATWYVVNRSDKVDFMKARDEWFAEHCPQMVRHFAGTLLVGVGLDLPEMRVEIDVIAALPHAG